jgi:hypothetical protein
MPPPASKKRAHLTEADRVSLIQWLCLRTSRNDDTCARLVRFETLPVLTRSGSTILSTIKQDAPSSLSDDAAKFLLDSSPTNPNGDTGPRQTVRDPRLVDVVLLAALEACGAPAGQPKTPATEAEHKRCVEDVFARALKRPAPILSIADLETLFGVARSSNTPAHESPPGAPTAEEYRAWVRRSLRDPDAYKILTPNLLGVFVELPSDKIVGHLPLLEGKSKGKGTFYYRRKPAPGGSHPPRCGSAARTIARTSWRMETTHVI